MSEYTKHGNGLCVQISDHASALRQRDERIAELEKRCGVFQRGLEAEEKDCEALEDENEKLRQQIAALSAPVTEDEASELAAEFHDGYGIRGTEAFLAARKGAADGK